VYGLEPGLDFADQAAAMNALGGAQVVAFSHFACESTRRIADVILPIATLFENDATLTNLDGIDQRAVAAGKLPGQARKGWTVLRALGGMLALPGFEFTDLAGLRAGMQASAPNAARGAATVAATSEGFELAVSQGIYRVDGLTRRAQALQAHPLTVGPRLNLHPDDAGAIGLGQGAMVKVRNAAGTAALPVNLSNLVARGCAWVESGYGATAALGAGNVTVEAA